MPVNLRRKGIRSGLPVLKQIHHDNIPASTNQTTGPQTRGKRRSSGSPQQQAPSHKRAAFGDITNAYRNVRNVAKGKGKSSSSIPKPAKKSIPSTKKDTEVGKEETNVTTDLEKMAILSAGSSSSSISGVSSEENSPVDDVVMLSPASVPLPGSSPEDEVMDHVEIMNQKNLEKTKMNKENSTGEETVKNEVVALGSEESITMQDVTEPIKEDIVNIDEENKNDPNQSPEYAFEIFQYLKAREPIFRVTPYFENQKELTPLMRSILMDWLVEVQENFELNHETLYLAVKLVDIYLTRVTITKDTLQLLGAAAMFISCKFDERCPPALEDFVFICDDAYDRRQFIKMEKDILKCIDYDLGMPLSYRFLRRYAKCVHASMETLTLGRFILELSLMEAEFISTSESKLAAAVLLLAFKMKNSGKWDTTLEHFSGYKVTELSHLMQRLNAMLVKPPPKQLTTVRTKYSHKVFYEVAKIPPLEVLTL